MKTRIFDQPILLGYGDIDYFMDPVPRYFQLTVSTKECSYFVIFVKAIHSTNFSFIQHRSIVYKVWTK